MESRFSDTWKEAAYQEHSPVPQVKYDVAPEVAPITSDVDSQVTAVKSPSRPPITRWIVVAAIALVVIGAIAGGVGGYFAHRKRQSAPDKSTSTGDVSASSSSSDPLSFNTSTNALNDKAPNDRAPSDKALNGTAITSVAYTPDGHNSKQNYVIFYQHSNGDIRKSVYNESHWHPSELVTRKAKMGTGLTSMWLQQDLPKIHLYYIDKNHVLQELQAEHASTAWADGTLGLANIRAAESSSHLDSGYAGVCNGIGRGWVLYESPADGAVHEVVWDEEADTWTEGQRFAGLKAGQGFASRIDAAAGVWRLWGGSDKSELQEWTCADCCSNETSVGWQRGPTATTLSTSHLAITATGYEPYSPRMIYYQTGAGPTIRELNNTGSPPSERWIDKATSGPSGNAGTEALRSDGVPVITNHVLRRSRLSVADGARNNAQELRLFYQTDEADLAVLVRDVQRVGGWVAAEAVPVGMAG